LTVTPVTNQVYIANGNDNTVTVLTAQQVQAIPLTTAIAPIPGGLTFDPTPGFSFSAASTFARQAPTVENVYFQVDTWQGPWIAAATSGANFTGKPASALSGGTHIVYAFAIDGQDASSTGVAQDLIGNVTAEVFTATPPVVAHLDFSIGAAKGGSASATVKAGQTANYALQLSLTGGLPTDQLSVTVACTGAPAKATCAGPASAVAVTQTAPGAVAVSVTTTANALFPPVPYSYPRNPLRWVPVFWALTLLALVSCMLARKRAEAYGQRNALATRLAFAGSTVLFLAILVSMSGCGGGGGGGGGTIMPPSNGTPVGTYTLTVTATSGNLTRAQQLALTVQ
jgi:hypothetical protein